MTEHHRTAHYKTLQVLLTPIAYRKDETMAITATWSIKNGFKADAQKCAEEIRTLGDEIRAEQVLELARDENTELHKCFEWDDSIAAEKYRYVQAQRVIKMLVIKEEEKPDDRPPVRMFYKTVSNEGYKPTELIIKKQDEYDALLKRAYAELLSFKNKYSMLSELQDVFEAIDALK